MIVHRTGLADLPTDGHQLIERSSVDQITSVVLPIPIQIRRERSGVDGRVLEKSSHRFRRTEGRLGQLPQTLNKGLDRDKLDCRGHRSSYGLEYSAENRGSDLPYGSRPAPKISLLSPCATDGCTAVLRRRKSPGNSERRSHNPAATAAAHVSETSPSCDRSA